MAWSSIGRMWVVTLVLLVSCGRVSPTLTAPDMIPLGAIFDHDSRDIQGAFLHAIHQYNSTRRRPQLHAIVDLISTADAFKISRLICGQFSRQVYAMVAAVQPDSFDTLHSYANTFQMPFVTPWFPENVPNPSSGLMDYATSMRPDYHQAIIDLIYFYRWSQVIYLYDSHDGLLRLQDIYQNAAPAGSPFSIQAVRRIYEISDALDFLRSLESHNRWSHKHVVLDCGTDLAKQLIIGHVRDVHLGRRNYHYLLSGLVMDERWEEDVLEYGAINITGLRLVDTSRHYVRQFLNTWSNLNPSVYPGAGSRHISAGAALTYDAVRVVSEALTKLAAVHETMAVTAGAYRGLTSHQRISCETADSHQDVWEHGESITRTLRKVVVEGLTGNISFTDEGKRKGYSLDVVEMTFNSETVKIGTWNDMTGFEAHPVTYSRVVPSTQRNNKILVVTSILEEPFLMRKEGNFSGNDRFEGYSKDLAELIAHLLNFNYTLKLVQDNTYGAPDSAKVGGWNGMIGELVRKEADLAIAPLTITASRERVVDFTKPFMSYGISIMMKRRLQRDPGIFSFLAPLSEEIWLCVGFAYVGVAIVLFLVTRFSPYEWQVIETYNKTTLTNDFTICNSLWFTMGAVMQQGIDLCPRSLSGRIVSSVWWFFTLILISSYTANLAAFLTVERMATPIKGVDELARQTAVEYGVIEGGATKEFFQKTKINLYNRMWEFMSSRRHAFASSYEEGISRVRSSKGKYAFLIDSVKNEYVSQQPPCDTIRVGQNINTNGYGIATPIGSHIRDSLNLIILRLKEDGDLARLKNRWWFERSQCDHEYQQESVRDSLTLSRVAGLFYILTGGLVLAMTVALAEFCYKSKIDAASTKRSLSDAMKAKARLSVTGGKDTENGRVFLPSSQLLDLDVPHTNTHTQL